MSHLRFCFVVVLLLLSHISSLAQETLPKPRQRLWATLGVGTTTTHGWGRNLAGMLSGTFDSRHGLFAMRWLGTGKFAAENYPFIGTGTMGATEISGLYGIRARHKALTLSALAGLGVVWFQRSGSYGEEATTVLGLPLEVQLSVTSEGPVGVAVSLFGNVNSRAPYAGFMFCILIGSLKWS
ncbi:MAG: hypothetical protein HY961_04930 [Ignavibacteriae bacterium]|nr:hypothetical protein [Ignavibacteriota bacterium]